MQEVFLFIKADTGKADFLGIHEQIIKQVVLYMNINCQTLEMINLGVFPYSDIKSLLSKTKKPFSIISKRL
jgi:hypothetical protein